MERLRRILLKSGFEEITYRGSKWKKKKKAYYVKGNEVEGITLEITKEYQRYTFKLIDMRETLFGKIHRGETTKYTKIVEFLKKYRFIVSFGYLNKNWI